MGLTSYSTVDQRLCIEPLEKAGGAPGGAPLLVPHPLPKSKSKAPQQHLLLLMLLCAVPTITFYTYSCALSIPIAAVAHNQKNEGTLSTWCASKSGRCSVETSAAFLPGLQGCGPSLEYRSSTTCRTGAKARTRTRTAQPTRCSPSKNVGGSASMPLSRLRNQNSFT